MSDGSQGALGKSPFILIARIKVKEGMVDEYLKIASEVDNAVEHTEPGMLFHNFDADPTDPLSFTWTEVYRDSAYFISHVNNRPVQEYVGKHTELGDDFSVEICRNVSEEVINSINALSLPLKHFKTTRVGYVKEDYFK